MHEVKGKAQKAQRASKELKAGREQTLESHQGCPGVARGDTSPPPSPHSQVYSWIFSPLFSFNRFSTFFNLCFHFLITYHPFDSY